MRRQLGVVLFVSILLSACAPGNTRTAYNPKAAQINVNLGIAYMREGKNETAMTRLLKAKAQDPENPMVYSTLGILHGRLGELKKAEDNFRKAVNLAPKNSSFRNNYGAFLCNQKRYAEAEQQFMEAVKNPLYSTPEYAYVNAGLCVTDQVKREKYLRKALQINPKFSLALYQMARLSYEKNRLLSARAYLQRHNEVSSHTAASLWLGVRVEKKLGDSISSRKWASLLKRKFPDSEETRLLLEMSKK